MSNYSVNISWSEEDGGFIATIPEFKNLSAFGKTYEEALTEVRNVLEGYIETFKEDNVPLPPASTVSSYSGQIRLRIPTELHRTLALEAERQRVSLNTLMVSFLSLNYGMSRITNTEQNLFIVVVKSDSKTEVYPRQKSKRSKPHINTEFITSEEKLK